MQTMNQALLHYYKQGVISAETAQFYAGNATEMRQMLRRLDKERDDAQRARQQQKRRVSAGKQRRSSNLGQQSPSSAQSRQQSDSQDQ